MLSRVAHLLYWTARNLERAENIARFIEVNLNLGLDLAFEEGKQWESLIEVSGDKEVFFKLYPNPTQENVLHFLTFETSNPNSIYSCVHLARENARSVREIISTEMWQQVNRMFLDLKDHAPRNYYLEHAHEFYTQIKTHHQLFSGLWDGTMSHGEGWHFMNLGRMLERADKTSRLLDVKYFILLPQVEYVGSAFDNLQWAAVLKSASGLEMYRKQFQFIAPRNVAAFLIFDGDFPRAIRHCLAQAEYSLHRITGTHLGTFSNLPEQLLGRFRSQLEYSQIGEILERGLHEFLDEFQAQLNEVGNAIQYTFFEAKINTVSSLKGKAQ